MITREDMAWEEADGQTDTSETNRLRLMNRTLRTENDFL